MGTTNVGCALTGLEIAEGDPAYIAVLRNQAMPYDGHWIVMPPLRGIYTGYHSIDLTEDVPCLGLKAGDPWPNPAKEDPDNGVIYIHPKILETLGMTVVERHNGPSTNFRAMVEKDAAELREQFLNPGKILKMIQKFGGLASETAVAIAVSKTYHHHHRNWLMAMDTFCEALQSKDEVRTRKLENALELFARARLLRLAESELRRPLIPITWGPQETNDTARIAVFELAAQIARRRAEPEDAG